MRSRITAARSRIACEAVQHVQFSPDGRGSHPADLLESTQAAVRAMTSGRLSRHRKAHTKSPNFAAQRTIVSSSSRQACGGGPTISSWRGVGDCVAAHYALSSLSGIGQTCPDLAIAIFSGGEARTRLREIVMQNRPEPPFLRVLPIESPNQSLAALLDLASYMKIRSRNSALNRVRSATCARIWRKPKAGSR